MNKAGLTFCVFLLATSFGVWSGRVAAAADANTAKVKQAQTVCVEQWDAVPAAEVNIPKLTRAEVLAGVEKYINTNKSLHSWEAEYSVMWRQAPYVIQHLASPSGSPQGTTMPEITRKTEARIISNGGKWLYEDKKESENKTVNSHSRYVSNGKSVTGLWEDQKTAQVWTADKWNGISWTETVAEFMPWLPSKPVFAQAAHFPNYQDILISQDTELMPWYTRVNGHVCYVIELVVTAQHPLFKTPEELDAWKKGHPKEVETWLKAKTETGWLSDSRAKSGDVRTVKATTRLAIDPEFGFAIVRWARGLQNETPHALTSLFLKSEIIYMDFQKLGKEIYSPREMTYTEYSLAGEGQKKIHAETALHITNFAVDKTYPPEMFELKIPEGYSIIDANSGVVYTVGDSNETIAALLVGARARDVFYAKLSDGPAPSLEASQWFNSKPIRLSDYKGREIILHFWSIGCKPCVHDLPRLQEQYGRTLESSSGPLFISIHPFAEGKDLQQLQDMIKKYGITFPVMVDSGGDKQWPIGKTHKKYQVDGWPTNIKIDSDGHFAGVVDNQLINTTSRWLKSADSNGLK
jgi:peroxiredoxin